MTLKTKINFILIFLVVLDVVLSSTCLFFPTWWMKIMHGEVYADPMGMIKRVGAVWVAFTVFQAVALVSWQRRPYWLVLVAGIRWTEIFSDWFYWFFAEKLTWFGHAGLLVSPPANLLFGLLLLKWFNQLEKKSL